MTYKCKKKVSPLAEETFIKNQVRRMRLELTHRNRHYPLKVACLPISPSAQNRIDYIVPKTGLEPAQPCGH